MSVAGSEARRQAEIGTSVSENSPGFTYPASPKMKMLHLNSF